MIDAPGCELSDPVGAVREMARLESDLLAGAGAEVVAAGALLERVQSCGDDALLGRAWCLLSRTQSLQGQHEVALRSAYEGIRIFAALDDAAAIVHAGVHAELFRAAGAALAKLGRIAAALPVLEQAVQIAQAASERPAASESAATVPPGSRISAPTALVRALITLGLALLAIREIDAAIDVYDRALRATSGYPATLEDVLVDTMLVRSALTGALHERIKRERAAGHLELAEKDIAAARRLLDAGAWHVEEAQAGEPAPVAGPGPGTLSAYGRASYYAALGQHLLITARPAEALAVFQSELLELEYLGDAYEWGIADAHVSMAQARLALDGPREALSHGALALAALDRHNDSNIRAAALLIEAKAFRALGEDAAAYDALEKHHQLRLDLEAAAAQQYAAHMTARLGVERASADAETHRRIAEMLETLGQFGQEITANLDAVAVFQIFTRHVESLLRVAAFHVWLLDPSGERLMLAFGIEDGVAVASPDIPVAEADSLVALAVRERREIFCGSIPAASTAARTVPASQTMLAAPLIVAGRSLGVVSIRSDRPDGYDENERSIFRTLCTYAAIALDNATAYSKLEMTVLELQKAQAALAQQTAEFERLSMTDALTGVANRRHLHDRAQVEIAAVMRKAAPLSVVMFDIDHFKRVNDTHGHAAGDAVLQKIAQVAKDWLRPGDLIARVGGEEFALLLPGAGMREAVAVAERIRASIAETVVVVGEANVRVTSSFGVATFDAACDTLEHALSRADRALYAAKLAGRDRVLATPSICV